MSRLEKRYPDVSTSRPQRLAIWIICIVMAGGTILAFFLPMIFPDVDANKIAQEQWMEEYMKQLEEESAAENETASKYEIFGGWEISTFNADKVKDLTVKTLREGDGKKVAKTDTIKAYYTGWTPTGTIFDSTKSIDGKNEVRSFALNEVIPGWTEGLTGRKVGGVYMLTIPSAMAYGEYGAGTMIPPNTPLRFIVEIVGIE